MFDHDEPGNAALFLVISPRGLRNDRLLFAAIEFRSDRGTKSNRFPDRATLRFPDDIIECGASRYIHSPDDPDHRRRAAGLDALAVGRGQDATRRRAQDRDARANCMSVISLRPAII
jgi:hypothetical protein